MFIILLNALKKGLAPQYKKLPQNVNVWSVEGFFMFLSSNDYNASLSLSKNT